MLQSAIPAFYLRGTSPVAAHIFNIVSIDWTNRLKTTGENIDVTVNGPPEIWRAITAEYPEMPHQIRREILDEVMSIILDHAELSMSEVGGHA